MILRSRSPVRVSFGGGGTDVPPYCNEHGGCVVSATINKYAYGTLATRGDKEIHIESADFLKSLKFGSVDELTYDQELDALKAVIKNMSEGKGVNVFIRSDVPPRSGLGGSASVFAALIGLFNHMKKEKKMTDYEVAELAHRLEREELRISGGMQDQYAAVFGGLNYIEFTKNWVRVNPLRMMRRHILELEKNLVLVFAAGRATGTNGNVLADILADQKKGYEERKGDVVDALHKTKAIAQDMRFALLRGDLTGFGELMHKAWEEKKKFSSLISTGYINDLYNLAMKHGAIGGKITGAGGGGFMVFYCESNKEHNVAKELEKTGARPVPFSFDFKGLQTWEV